MKVPADRIKSVQALQVLHDRRLIHLKTIQPFYDLVASRRKGFELRRNDRDFSDNIFLCLWEYGFVDHYSGQCEFVFVDSILEDFYGLESGYCIMSTSLIKFSLDELLATA